MFFFQLISMNPRPGKVESAVLSQVSSENGSTLKTLWPTWTQTGRRHIRHVAIVAVSVTVIHWELLDFVEATSRGWSLCQH
jgi:hypothetical protein